MSVVGDLTGDLMRAMGKQSAKDKPEGATSIYTVHWHMKSDSFEATFGKIGSAPTAQRLHRHKTFVSKAKAELLAQQIRDAYNTLGYMFEGVVHIEETWLE